MRFLHSDISEDDFLAAFGYEVTQRLLRDHALFQHLKAEQGEAAAGREDDCHIIWATSDYAALGEGYGETDFITIDRITQQHGRIIRPRAVKDAEQQRQRTQGKAEVFTPAWLCNIQNNLIDDAWFGREHVFNTPDGEHGWKPSENTIAFPEGKTWQDYIATTRLEITCGEAPYLFGRYDTTTAELIPIHKRAGILDRKLRVVGENCATPSQWLPAARRALQSCYGYEWQGDSLLIARETAFITMIEHYCAHFHTHTQLPPQHELEMWAYIISWNLWQMDGLRGRLPLSIGTARETDLFATAATTTPATVPLRAATPQGIRCYVRHWPALGKPGNGKKEPWRQVVRG